ncbi:MAG: UDP-N-acetylglucosamine--N-acetylmuramyl-(pentapeptide) pyrophosphoryl-undecaprenol N-acetylglucosamine transferase [Anaerolineae bacterium]
MYPGLAVVQALRATGESQVTYVGGQGGIEEELAARAGLRFVGIPAGGVHGLRPWLAAQNFVKLIRGFRASLRWGRRELPSVVFATGGYASVPVALAAWVLQVPILVYLPDIEPGLAVRFIARLASKVAVTVESSRAYFSARKTVVTGYPVRSEFHEIGRTEAREALGLLQAESVLLVMGGSRGARSINRALGGMLEQVLDMTQVVHLSGELDWPSVSRQRHELPERLKERYHAFPYLHEIGYALASADLALCRSGASTLGELPFFALPAILVPYPHAWRYQRVNAEWLTERGAALMIRDERLARQLLSTLQQLLMDRDLLAQMAERARALSRPDAAVRLAENLRSLG